MKKSIILSLVLVSFVLCSCEEAFEAIEVLDGPANCEESRDPIDDFNDVTDEFIRLTEVRTDLTEEEIAIEIEDYNRNRQLVIDELNNSYCD